MGLNSTLHLPLTGCGTLNKELNLCALVSCSVNGIMAVLTALGGNLLHTGVLLYTKHAWHLISHQHERLRFSAAVIPYLLYTLPCWRNKTPVPCQSEFQAGHLY